VDVSYKDDGRTKYEKVALSEKDFFNLLADLPDYTFFEDLFSFDSLK